MALFLSIIFTLLFIYFSFKIGEYIERQITKINDFTFEKGIKFINSDKFEMKPLLVSYYPQMKYKGIVRTKKELIEHLEYIFQQNSIIDDDVKNILEIYNYEIIGDNKRFMSWSYSFDLNYCLNDTEIRYSTKYLFDELYNSSKCQKDIKLWERKEILKKLIDD